MFHNQIQKCLNVLQNITKLMKKRRNIVCTRFDDNNLSRIDKLIADDKYDSRSSFVRRATIEKIERETKILA